ncbi:hypothetical protein FHT76_000507 [Rhizobium sp. BK176]|nr:hypothetical protein [Rhizobium sp. BK176]
MERRSVSIAPRLGFLYRIGGCPKCMRQSFLVAGAATLSLGGVKLVERLHIYSNAWLEVALLCLTVSAIALWLSHVSVRSYRILLAQDHSGQSADPVGEHSPRSSLGVGKLRREFLKKVFLVIGSTALATAIPSLANASGECPGRLNCGWGSCAQRVNSDAYCCPRGFPILSLCDCQCYKSVQGMPCNQTGSCFDENF